MSLGLLKEKLKDDLKKSLKSGDNVTRDVLRMLSSEVKNAEIEKREELKDEGVVEIIKRSVKRRKDSIEQYKKGKRNDLVAKEENELHVLEKYMPEQMSENEIKNIAREVIKEVNATGVSDFGKVMGLVMKKTQGKADGTLVGRIVKEELNNK